MTTETVQDVLREMRRIAAIQPQEFADRIERALAGSEPIGEVKLKQNPSNSLERYKVFDCVSPVLICQRYPVGTKFYAHPAIGNKPAVDDAMVRRAIKSSGMADADWHTGRILWPHNQCREAVMNAARAALTAALIDSAQDGKGE